MQAAQAKGRKPQGPPNAGTSAWWVDTWGNSSKGEGQEEEEKKEEKEEEKEEEEEEEGRTDPPLCRMYPAGIGEPFPAVVTPSSCAESSRT